MNINFIQLLKLTSMLLSLRLKLVRLKIVWSALKLSMFGLKKVGLFGLGIPVR